MIEIFSVGLLLVAEKRVAMKYLVSREFVARIGRLPKLPRVHLRRVIPLDLVWGLALDFLSMHAACHVG
ncbi:MAG: hypothetical protein ACYDA9_17295 [Terriglobia bacterium]